MPAKDFGVVKRRHFQRHEQTLADARNFFMHREMTKHLEILNGQRMTAVIIRDDFGSGGDTFLLPYRFNDGGALISDGRDTLRHALAKLIERLAGKIARIVAPRRRTGFGRSPTPANDQRSNRQASGSDGLRGGDPDGAQSGQTKEQAFLRSTTRLTPD